jgi:hypothetical protein
MRLSQQHRRFSLLLNAGLRTIRPRARRDDGWETETSISLLVVSRLTCPCADAVFLSPRLRLHAWRLHMSNAQSCSHPGHHRGCPTHHYQCTHVRTLHSCNRDCGPRFALVPPRLFLVMALERHIPPCIRSPPHALHPPPLGGPIRVRVESPLISI